MFKYLFLILSFLIFSCSLEIENDNQESSDNGNMIEKSIIPNADVTDKKVDTPDF